MYFRFERLGQIIDDEDAIAGFGFWIESCWPDVLGRRVWGSAPLRFEREAKNDVRPPEAIS